MSSKDSPVVKNQFPVSPSNVMFVLKNVVEKISPLVFFNNKQQQQQQKEDHQQHLWYNVSIER